MPIHAGDPRNFRAAPPDWFLDPAPLPVEAEVWALAAERHPCLIDLHMRATGLRLMRPLSRRESEWLDLLAEVDNLALTSHDRSRVVEVLARAGACERFLSETGQKEV